MNDNIFNGINAELTKERNITRFTFEYGMSVKDRHDVFWALDKEFGEDNYRVLRQGPKIFENDEGDAVAKNCELIIEVAETYT